MKEGNKKKLKQKKKIQEQEKKEGRGTNCMGKTRAGEMEQRRKKNRQEDDRRKREQMKQSKADERMKTIDELKQWKLECDKKI